MTAEAPKSTATARLRQLMGLDWGPLWDGLSLAIVSAVVFIAFATFRDYGITWDETWHMHYGQYILEWYRTGFSDRTALSYRGDYLYGGGYDGLGAIMVRAIPMKWNETIHLFGSLVGILGLVGTWRLGRVLAGPLGGFWALVLLVTTPTYYGHMFNNPKDLPFAVGYVWAMGYLVEAARSLPRVPRSLWIKTSLACGAGLSVRIGGLLLHCYLLAAMVVFLAHAWWRTRSTSTVRSLGWRFGKRFLAVLGGSWLVMLVFWPWAILDPIRRPFFALGRMTRFNLHVRKMPFGDGEIYTYDVPWDYLLRYFGMKLPEPVIVLAVVALVVAVRHAWLTYRSSEELSRNLGNGVMALGILFPPVYAVLVHATLYDGHRHFLFIVPPACAAGAAVLVGAARMVRERSEVPGWTIHGVLALLCVQQARTMIELHPHEYVHFNRVAGGLPGVYKRYDTDYYGNAYKEAFELLQAKLWETEREEYLNKRYRITGCIPDFVAENYLPPNFFWKEKHDKARADFFLGYQRSGCHDRHVHRPMFVQVERQGTPLIMVREMRTKIDKKKKRKSPPKPRAKKKPGRAKPRPEAPLRPPGVVDSSAPPSTAPPAPERPRKQPKNRDPASDPGLTPH